MKCVKVSVKAEGGNMSMVKCPECSTSYNKSLVTRCPLCEGRKRDRLLEQAHDPATSPDVLGELALSAYPEIAKAAQQNPNTPEWARDKASATPKGSDESAHSRGLRSNADMDSGPAILAELRRQTVLLSNIRFTLYMISSAIGIIFLFLAFASCAAGDALSGP